MNNAECMEDMMLKWETNDEDDACSAVIEYKTPNDIVPRPG